MSSDRVFRVNLFAFNTSGAYKHNCALNQPLYLFEDNMFCLNVLEQNKPELNVYMVPYLRNLNLKLKLVPNQQYRLKRRTYI